MRVGFTDGAFSVVEMYARGDGEAKRAYLEQLAETVVNIRRVPGLEVDTFDKGLSFAGVPLSFVRDWREGEAIIMTNTEAAALDMGQRAAVFTLNL